MSIAVITGSAGLIGSEATQYFADAGLDVIGIDNDMRRRFFGDEASTRWNRKNLERNLGRHYRHAEVDIRDREGVESLFQEFGSEIKLVVHTAAQPSHDWAAREPHTDFGVNAVGTLNLARSTPASTAPRRFSFSPRRTKFTATRRIVYRLSSGETRWEIADDHTYAGGIREDMSIDQTTHSLFGASKVAADVLVQEYGRYFDMRTACFPRRMLDGPQPQRHAAARPSWPT